MRPLLLLACVLATASAASVQELHADGTRASTASVDKDGRRDGVFTAWWPGGTILKEKAVYRDGVLHGIRQRCDEKGRVQVDETWINGTLIYPRSQVQVVAGLKQVETETMAYMATFPKPSNPTAAPLADQAKALTRLRQYRWLCGLAHDVALDDAYIDRSQEGAKLLAILGRLDHTPTKPDGMDEAVFKRAYEGTSHGNLAQGYTDLVTVVDLLMDDSDPTNIDRLGHRRWLLNPTMASTGFGISGKFSVVYALDSLRKQVPAQSWQAFPPPGFIPVDYFGQRHAWHFSMNPNDYVVDLKAMSFQIWALDPQLRRMGKQPLALDYDASNGDGFGSYRNARIVRPGEAKEPGKNPGKSPASSYQVSKGRSYEAVVGGLKPRTTAPAEIRFVVTFY